VAFRTRTLLPALDVPALVIAGDHDGYADEAVVAELVAALPDPDVVRLPGVGHLPNLEAAAAFDAASGGSHRACPRRPRRTGPPRTSSVVRGGAG
jgi:pimeloyl-ACP methyl ester carboxylesterase